MTWSGSDSIKTSADPLPTIASFWYGSDLSWLEALSIQSFLDRGHRFVLYTSENLAGVPIGTDVRAASEIYWPPPFDVSDNDRLRVAVFSDIFRLRMIKMTGYIWSDLDAYCVRPFDFTTPYVFAQSQERMLQNGIVGLPQDPLALEAILNFLETPNPTQPWRGGRLHRINQRRVAQGESWGIESLSWGCSGPKALDYFLKRTGEDSRAMPSDTFYPLPIDELWKLHAPQISTQSIERAGVYSVHVYGHQKKYIASALRGLPREGSYLDHLCKRHGIDPSLHKVPYFAWIKKTMFQRP